MRGTRHTAHTRAILTKGGAMHIVRTHHRTLGVVRGAERRAVRRAPRRAALTVVLTVLALLLFAAEAHAYAHGQLIWAKRIGTSASFAGAYAVAAGPNGVTAIAGYRVVGGSDNPLVAKYTAAGKRAWLKTYPAQGEADAVACDRGGNVYVAVKVWRSSYDIGLLKYDAAGRFKWERFYDGPAAGADEPVAIAVDRGGNVVVAGNSPAVNGRLGVVVLKYRPTGALAWPAARFDSDPMDVDAGDVYCKGLGLDGSGNAYLGGYSYHNPSGTWLESAVTLKVGAGDGVTKWSRTYVARHNPASWADSIAVRGAWVVVTGSTGGPTDETDALVVKYSLGGTEKYWKEWGVDNGLGEWFGGVALDEKGNVLVTGDQWLQRGAASNKAITMKLSATLGKVVWKKTYQPTGMYAQGWFLTRDALGNVYVSGIRQNAAGDDDLLTMEYSATGTRKWAKTWSGGGPDDDWPYGIVVGTTGGVYVTGWITAPGDVWQAALLKYQQ